MGEKKWGVVSEAVGSGVCSNLESNFHILKEKMED